MANILNLGTSALLSIQQAMNTTGHNISNVNTEGYSRQRTVFETRDPQFFGGMYTGNGVSIASINRIHDQFLTDEVRSRTSAKANYDTLASLTSKLDNLLADSKVGLSPAINKFFAAMDDVASDPSSLPQRQVLLGEAQNLADRFSYLNDTVNSIRAQLNTRIETSVAEINALAQDVAQINERIIGSRIGVSNTAASDLLDQRDRLLDELAQRIGITAIEQSDGAVNVMVGTGQALVAGTSAEKLTTFSDPFSSQDLSISVDGSNIDISKLIKGGELGAVLSFREQGLSNARSQLGLVAMGVSHAVNAQNRLGQDLDGNFGGDLFTSLEPSVVSHPANTGTGSVTAAVSDSTGLTGDDYSLYYDGSQYVLTNLTTKATQTGAGPFTVDGITITPSGAPAASDRFVVSTSKEAGGHFGVTFTRPEQIAAAAPVRTDVTGSNVGSAEISLERVNNLGALPLAGTVTLTFDPNAMGAGSPGFTVAGMPGGPLAYDPATQSGGATLNLGGMDFQVKGVPQAGDSLAINNNVGGVGDNRNALLMSGLQTANTVRGGTASFKDVYGTLVATVGVSASQAKSSAAAEATLLSQAKAADESVSGVNLDEEAANLLHYQQAYQAAARIITVADQMFQTLISATRR